MFIAISKTIVEARQRVQAVSFRRMTFGGVEPALYCLKAPLMRSSRAQRRLRTLAAGLSVRSGASKSSARSSRTPTRLGALVATLSDRRSSAPKRSMLSPRATDRFRRKAKPRRRRRRTRWRWRK